MATSLGRGSYGRASFGAGSALVLPGSPGWHWTSLDVEVDGSDVVIGVPDQIGSNDANDFNASSILTAGPGGHPYVEMVSFTRYIQRTTLTGGSPGNTSTRLLVCKVNALAASFQILCGSGLSGGDTSRIENRTANNAIFQGTLQQTAGGATTNWERRVAVFNGATSTLFINGVKVLTDVAAGTGDGDGVTVGRNSGGWSASGGGWAEHVGYYDALSDGDVAQLDAWAADRCSELFA